MSNTQRKHLAAAVAAACAGLTATGAMSQSAGNTDAAAGLLEEIVVTVDRREKSIQDYAGTAQAFSQDDLAANGVGAEFTNLQYVIPGAVISNQEGNINVTVRGVGSADNTELIDASVANHFNGVYLPRARGISAMFYDIERVEVNKGPQGTTRGRNAVGGTVNIVARKPSLEQVEAAIAAEAGSENLTSYEAMVNLPIGDSLGLRAAIFSRESDSYYKNAGAVPSLDPAGELDEFSGRLSALWAPTDALTVYAVYDHTTEGGTGYPGLNYFDALNAGFDVDDLDDDAQEGIFRGWQGELDSTHKGFMAQVTYDFGGFSLEYTGSTRDLDFEQINASNDGVNFPGQLEAIGDFDNFGGQFWLTESDAQIHELRLASAAEGSIQWSTGIFFFDEEQKAALLSTSDNSFCCYSGTEFAMPDVDGESTAYYGEVTFALADDKRLAVGLRHTREEKSRFGIGGNYGFAVLGQGGWGAGNALTTRWATPGFQYHPWRRSSFTAPTDGNDLAGAIRLLNEGVTWGTNDDLDDYLAGNCVAPDPTDCPLEDVQPNGQTIIQQEGSYKDDFNDYRVGFEWDIGDAHLLYLTTATGHKSGGFNDTFIDGTGTAISNEFAPEKLVMYEIGSKNQFESLILNGSLFFYDYDDYVLTQLVSIGQPADPDDPPPTSAQRVNVGTVEITGLEIETTYALNNYFTLGGSLLLLDAEFESASITDFRQGFGANPNVDLSGNKVPLTSERNLNLFVRGEFPLPSGQVDFTLSSTTRSEYFLSAFNSQGFDADGNPVPLSETPNNGAADQGLGFSDKVDGYTLFNLTAGYSNDEHNFRVEGYVNNITDEIVSTKAILQPNLNLRFMNNPRTAGVRVKYTF
ncbi:TonB-dependent receptor [Exilibacterium tricleocarpae]|uniref:TonB-dependent receptor n=1 Tax=Exilibacterium tricleocarpae TaxID=2591008 RepID=A0A545SY67_9GAMM|nr:TonB-dependent receptor [Exilibacterium tricleocarpae]TQV69907.1 TonB-dependent receptor [Exilibacterium tricleocarpae]